MSKAAQPKKLLMSAGQNQTIRRSFNARDKYDLSTCDISTCVTVILRDEQGNASLTHIDPTADLDFIKREKAEFIKDPFTIDVCAIPGTKFPEKVMEYVTKNFPDFKNSKGEQNLRKLKRPENKLPTNVLVDLSVPRESALKQPTSAQIDEVYTSLFAPDFGLKQYEQSIRQYFGGHRQMTPPVAIDGNGRPQKYFSVLAHPEIRDFLSAAREDIKTNNNEALIARCVDLAKTHGNREVFSEDVISTNYSMLLPITLREYFAMVEKAAPHPAPQHRREQPHSATRLQEEGAAAAKSGGKTTH